MSNRTLKATARRANAKTRREQAHPADVKAVAPQDPNHSRQPSKLEVIRGLLELPNGASLEQLVSATGWQPHSVRAGMTGLRKQGLTVTRTKADGTTRFAIEVRLTEAAA